MQPGLEIRALEVFRGPSQVIRGIELNAPQGEVTVLLGANGAGKTTLMEAISGVLRVSIGSIHFGGHDITRASRTQRAELGLSHVEQGRKVFPFLTVGENLSASGGRESIATQWHLFPELRSKVNVPASELSGGEQQMLVIARGIVRRPKMLLVDEMSLGLAPSIVLRLIEAVRRVADEGIGVLLVEQFASLALSIGHTAYVINRGRVVYGGACAALANDPALLRRAYFGDDASATAATVRELRVQENPRP